MKTTEKTTKWMLFLGLPALLFLAFGCGLDQSPVAHEEQVLASETGRAAKIAQIPEGRISSKIIGSGGDTLLVKDDNGKGTKDNLVVILKVPANALAADELITMAVYGETLADLVVEFSPGGLEFLKPAILKIRMGVTLIDAPLDQAIAVQHIYGDGTVESAKVLFYAEKDNGKIRFKVEVPGFSRYSMSGNGP